MAADMPQVEGVEHRWADAGGLRVHYAEAGPADAPPVLLVHGWPQHWYMWRRVIEALGGELRLIVPDLRGFGWTEAPGGGYDPETFASDQIALLDALGLERAGVVGHDWGGFVAFLLGIRHPERITGLVACNVSHPWSRPSAGGLTQIWRSWYAAGMALPGLGKRLAADFMPRFLLTHGHVGEPFTAQEVELYLGRLRAPERAAASTMLYRSYQRMVVRLLGGAYRDLRLTVPARLVFGVRDMSIPVQLTGGWEPYADDMRVELVPDSGHFSVDERPELVVARAREMFVGAARPSPASS